MSPRANFGCSAQAGFTLVEALAALLLLSVSLVLFGATLRLEQRVAEASRARERLFAFGAGVDAISGLLTRAISVVNADDDQQRKILFYGQPTQIKFVTLSEGNTHAGGLLAALISYNHGSAGIAGGDIRLGTETMRFGDRRQFPIESVGSTMIVANVDAARFRYFGTKVAGQPAKWYDSWSDEVALPQLVMMSVSVRLRRETQAFEFFYRLSES